MNKENKVNPNLTSEREAINFDKKQMSCIVWDGAANF